MTQSVYWAAASIAQSPEAACAENPFGDIDALCTRTEQSDMGKVYGTEPGCEYYRMRHDDFLLRHAGTGRNPPDYYLDYGEKYCNKFTQLANNPHTSPQVREWAKKTKCELQKSLEKNWSEDLELRPDDLKSMAFDTHCDAYLAGGLKELDDIGSWLEIVDVVDLEDLLSPEGRSQVNQCAWPVIWHWTKNRMKDPFESDRKQLEYYEEHGGLPLIPIPPHIYF